MKRAVFAGIILSLFLGVNSSPQIVLQGGDNIDNAYIIPSPNFSDSGTTVGYIDDYDGNCGTDGGAPDVVYRLVPTGDHGVTISFRYERTDFWARLYVFRDTPDSVVACIDDPYSQIPCLSLVDGYTYYFVIDGYDGASGHYSFFIDLLSLPPSIEGTVTGMDSEPLGGATIRVLHDDVEVWRDTTWDSGHFEVIPYLWSDIYTVEASKSGYFTQTSEPVYSAPCEHHIVDFALQRIDPPPIGSLAGNVYDDDGTTPIEGALVRAEYTDGSWFIYDTTGAEGQFSFPEMQTVLYNVQASREGYITQTQNGVEVFPDQTTWVVFELQHEIFYCPYTPGDVNDNGSFNGLDIVYMVSFFKGGPTPGIDCHPYCPNQPDPFYAAGDVNGDCVFNGLDIVYFVTFLKGWLPDIHYCPDCPPAP